MVWRSPVRVTAAVLTSVALSLGVSSLAACSGGTSPTAVDPAETTVATTTTTTPENPVETTTTIPPPTPPPVTTLVPGAAPTTATPVTVPPTRPGVPAPTAATLAPVTTATGAGAGTAAGATATACAPASWRLDAGAFYDRVNLTTGSAVRAAGGLRIDLGADGTARFTYERVVLELAPGTTGTFDGPITGRYLLVGDQLAGSDVRTAVTATVTTDGQSTDASVAVAAMVRNAPFDGVRVACDATRMTVTYLTPPLTGVSVTWARTA